MATTQLSVIAGVPAAELVEPIQQREPLLYIDSVGHQQFTTRRIVHYRWKLTGETYPTLEELIRVKVYPLAAQEVFWYDGHSESARSIPFSVIGIHVYSDEDDDLVQQAKELHTFIMTVHPKLVALKAVLGEHVNPKLVIRSQLLNPDDDL